MSFLINPYIFGGAAFSPSDESGLWMWLKADAIVGLSDGDPVTTWEDSGTGDHDATSSGSNRPTYQTAELNSLPVVRFTNAAVSFLNLEDMSGLTEGEMFIVFKNTTDPPSAGTGRVYDIGSSADVSHHPFTDGSVYDDFGTTVRKSCGNPATSLASFVTYNVWSATNDWAAEINGSAFFSTGTNTVGFAASPVLGVAFEGDIAEIIVYDHKVSGTVRGNVRGYLQTKYAHY
jgi:hypothetical protein